MRYRFGLAAIATLAVVGLLALALVFAPDGTAQAQAQATAAAEPILPPLSLFLVRPSSDLATVLGSLKITEQQGQAVAAILTEETQLLREAAARNTLTTDAGPIGQNSWKRLQTEALLPEQYATLRNWAAANRGQAMQVLQEAISGASPMVTAMPAVNGTPTAPPEIKSLVATAQASPAAAETPAMTAQVRSVVVTQAVALPASGTAQPAAVAAVAQATPAAPTVAATTQATTIATSAATVLATPMPTSAATTAATAAPTTAATVAATTAATSVSVATTGSPTPPAPVARATGMTPGSITVVGEGQAVATPNVAHVNLGVEVISTTVRQASTDANTTTAAIIAKLKSLGVADKDIQTSQYTIIPFRDQDRPVAAQAGQPAATAAPPRQQYRVISTVSVKLRDLNAVGAAIDGAVDAGANIVGGIQFTVDDPTPVADQARGNAVADARRQAQLLAQAAGVTLGPPIIITQVIGSVTPRLEMGEVARSAVPAAAAPPVQGGELTFSERIQITFEMRP